MNKALATTNALLFLIALILLKKFFPEELSGIANGAIIVGAVVAVSLLAWAIVRFIGTRGLRARLAPLIEKRERLWKEGEYEFAEKFPDLPPMTSIAFCSQAEEWQKVSSEINHMNLQSSFRIVPFP